MHIQFISLSEFRMREFQYPEVRTVWKTWEQNGTATLVQFSEVSDFLEFRIQTLHLTLFFSVLAGNETRFGMITFSGEANLRFEYNHKDARSKEQVKALISETKVCVIHINWYYTALMLSYKQLICLDQAINAVFIILYCNVILICKTFCNNL